MKRLASLLACSAALAFVSAAQAATPVNVPHFRSVELRGGGHVTMHRGDGQRVTLLEGSTGYTKFHIEDGDRLVIDACDGDCPMHYDLRVDIATPEISGVAVKGGGEIETQGEFSSDRLAAAVHGGGLVDLRSVDAGHVTAAVDGGGQIKVRAERSLTAAVNGGGEIRYWGNPQVMQAVNGGGSVDRGD